MKVVIRRMRESDRPRVMELLDAWNMAPFAPTAEIPAPDRTGLDVERTWVAEADGRVVGTASYILRGEGAAETSGLAVDPSLRGARIGERLHEERLAEMKRIGITRAFTETDRPWVIEWYRRKFGCRVVGTKPKAHAFSEPGINEWTILELDLRSYKPPSGGTK